MSYTATHQGEFAGVAASARTLRFAAWDLMRVRDGKVVELTSYCDLFTVLSHRRAANGRAGVSGVGLANKS